VVDTAPARTSSYRLSVSEIMSENFEFGTPDIDIAEA